MTDAAIAQEVAALRATIEQLVQLTAPRMSRADVCTRLGIHRNTLTAWQRQRRFPQPGRDGKWSMADVMRWERTQPGDGV